jgi:uncharacterized delta-60 repeat protein
MSFIAYQGDRLRRSLGFRTFLLLGALGSGLAAGAPHGERGEGAGGRGERGERGERFELVLPHTVQVPLGGLAEIDVTLRRQLVFDDAVTLTADATPGLIALPGAVEQSLDLGSIRVGAAAPLTVGSTFELRIEAQSAGIVRTAVTHATVVPWTGALDASFGGTGTFVAALSKYDRDGFEDVQVQPGGDVLAAGPTHTISGTFFLAAHVRADGSADPAWGGPGIGLQGSGAFQLRLHDRFKEEAAYAIRRQSNGTAVLAGYGHRGRDHVGLAGIRPDGTPDLAFGATGTKVLDHTGSAAALAMTLEPDDGMVVAGYHDTHAFVARLAPDGSPDPGFAQGVGHVDLDLAPGVASRARGVVLDGAGRILVAGEAGTAAFVARLSPESRTDDGFRATLGGLLPAPNGSDVAVAKRILLQPDGAILVGGYVRKGGTSFVAVWRLLPDGAPDPHFGTHGLSQIHVKDAPDPLAGLVLFPDGRIVLAVNTDVETPNAPAIGTANAKPFLVRLLPDGRPDPDFGEHGFVRVLLGRGDVLFSIDRAGAAVVLGLRLRVESTGAQHPAIARILL